MYLKFYTPDSNWTWFVTEGQPRGDDFIFFGHVCGFEDEWEYFTLSEPASVGGGVCLLIERDLYFVGDPFREVIACDRNERVHS